MTDSIQTLRVLLDRHQRDRDAALAVRRRAEAAAVAARQQAEQLEQYRRDYEQRWNERFRTEGTIDLLRCYRSFCDRLSAALEQQTAIAAHAAAQAERTREVLRDAEVRCASVEKLIERRLAEAARLAERRDQRQTDEAASRAASRRNGGGHAVRFG